MFEVWLLVLSLSNQPSMTPVGEPILGFDQCVQAGQVEQQRVVLEGMTNTNRFVAIYCLPVIPVPEVHADNEAVTG